MSFFKYLVFIFLTILSANASAFLECKAYGGRFIGTGGQPLDACKDLYVKLISPDTPSTLKSVEQENGNGDCSAFSGNNFGSYECKSTCPAKGWPLPVYLPKGTTKIPTRMCKDGCTVEGGGNSIDTNNYVMTTMQFTGDSVNCNEEYANEPKKCDTKDPYGDCFVPPNDNCVRLKDGSITCPDNSPPPPNNNTCNGATYCKRPPQGCGEGYVSGSFNGEQLCVRSGPNKPSDPPKPDNPQDQDNCMTGGSYCPQPPDNTTCPDGYYETTYNGSKICVKNNPDPEKPNPNDPTGGKGPEGGDGGDDGGDGGTGGSIDLKPVIDAINALKNALLSAISGISAKIDQLVNGQKQTNEKLDTSNEHLDKIEDATQAASEAVGQTNKKLDGLKDAVEGSYKCKNESYNPSDKTSPKYRECTESDLPASEGHLNIDNISIPESYENYVTWSAACPPDVSIPINLMGQSSSLVLSWSPWCELLSKIRWAIIACAYFAAAYIILGMR